MNMQHAQNLSTAEFVRMFERDAKTELEQALFSRLTDCMDIEQDYDTLYEEHEKLKERFAEYE